LSKVRATLLWLEEWLSLSQNEVEKVMMFIYLICGIMNSVGSIDNISIMFMGWIMYSLHKNPDVNRAGIEHSPIAATGRPLVQIWTLCMIVTYLVPPIRTKDVIASIQVVDYLLFSYLVSVSTKGDPGRRRKLAWSKIKELFGTKWLPEPIEQPS